MTIRIYNTLAREKQDLEPVTPGRVGMYVCGPTVYDYAHIGNARPVIVFDVLYRLLRHEFGAGNVKYVRNITDVDDKIIAAADESGEEIASITARTTEAFHADVAALGALPPDEEPRATGHIPEMIALIEDLIAKDHAYEADGHVLFDVSSMAGYGRLSRHSQDELIAGSRVEVAPYKRNPTDFVLWKPSTGSQPGWDGPWGFGRPGWHLECSAMSEKHLGINFDIHGGGQDLIFPHHENEIAQSTCSHGAGTFAKYWMHNGYLQVEGEKMSKSLGNFITVHDLLKAHHGETIRLAMLMTHYRRPINWTADGLIEAKNILDGWYGTLRRAQDVPIADKPNLEWFDGKPVVSPVVSELQNDLSTPGAIQRLSNIEKRLSQGVEGGISFEVLSVEKEALLSGADLLGLLQLNPEDWFKWQPEGTAGLSDADIDALIEERDGARAGKNFDRADEIRDRLAEAGILLEDGAGGTTWRRA